MNIPTSINRTINLLLNEKDRMIDNAVESAIDYTKEKVINYFGYELIYDLNLHVIRKVINIINRYTPEEGKKIRKIILDVDNKYSTNLFNILKLEEKTYLVIRSGRYYNVDIDVTIGRKVPSKQVNLYVFGKKSYKYYKMIHAYIERPFKDNTSTDSRMRNVISYDISGTNDIDEGFVCRKNCIRSRSMESLFFEGNIKEEVIKHLDNFFANKEIYNERDIIYKTGILLHGSVGTGKTSLMNAISNRYALKIINIDMTSFANINTDMLSSTINEDTDTYIIAIEEIDCIVKNRENNTDKEEDLVINKLLKFLDSTNSPNNVIFIATTNYLDRLDEAIKREGRFDLIIEVGPIYKEKAIEMCKSFKLNEDDINKVLNDCKEKGYDLIDTPIPQSKLQNLIIKESHVSVVDTNDINEDNTSN